jgi:hypothetical protein
MSSIHPPDLVLGLGGNVIVNVITALNLNRAWRKKRLE